MKRISFLTILIVLVTLGFTVYPGEKAYACSCVDSTALEKLDTYSAVFEGKVTEKGARSQFGFGEYRKYTFEAVRAWKGVNGQKVTIHSLDHGSSSCGFQFTKGETYLVFASSDEKDHTLKTTLCSGNKLISQADEDVQLLGAGEWVTEDDSGSTNSSPNYLFPLILGSIGLFLVIVVAIIYVRRRQK
ncbi:MULTISPECIES: hypothetical protein [unclassified Paenibacillus]|uniref:hypothetical protein n=1 Tax=unclassified Paenibacillus TaxID=185978 RepID=UPI000FE1FED2|nr:MULTISPECIES: hypothetical protein [unclassified Paenibacillus]MCM3170701.1 hypothetical protein [Paenibacillus sp. MER 99-2]